ncbi:hypothetical protein PMAYCL1PPCAC_08359, partial [Pristionchus mayeri]
EEPVTLSSSKIPDLSKMTAFEFEDDQMRMFRSWKIGTGKKWEKKCVKRPKLESTLYRCPIETCSKEFLSEKNLERHMTKIYNQGAKTGSKTDPRTAAAMMRNERTDDGSMLFRLEHLLNAQQIAGVFGGFKKTNLDKRARTHAGGSRHTRAEAKEPDEVNDLFNTEGDPDLEYKTEPLFDDRDLMWLAILND